MASTQLRVTDLISNTTVTVNKDDVAATITPWFPAAPAEVGDAVAKLQAKLDQGDVYTGGLESYLCIEIERLP